MEISQLKQEFTDYLESVNEEYEAENEVSTAETEGENTEDILDIPYESENENTSLFTYADELDDFLNKNYKDELENATIKTDNILNLEFKDGQFVEEEVKDEENSENKLPVVGIINDILKDEKIKEYIDKDGNKELTEEEAKKFISSIETLDGKNGDISVKDIIKGIKEIDKLNIPDSKEEIKTENYKVDENPQKDAKIEAEPDRTSSAPQVNGYTPASTVSYGNGGYYPSSNYRVSGNNLPKSGVTYPQTQTEADKLKNLEKLKTNKESELSKAQESYKEIFTGDNKNVKSAKNKYDKSKENYEKLLKNENGLTVEQKKKLEEALEKVENATLEVDKAQIQLQEAENAVLMQEMTVSGCESSLNALKSALKELKNNKNSETKSKISELKKHISEEEKTYKSEKSKLKDLTKTRDKAKKELEKKQEELIKAKYNKEKIENELIMNNDKVSQELKDAVKTLNQEDKNVQKTKDNEAQNIATNIQKAGKGLKVISEKINENKAEQIKNENSVSSFNFDFKENLSASQKSDLEAFKANYSKNKSRYKEVEKQTGVPAELIAAIHWRESNGDFSTYLHNGDPLGSTTVHVPEGIYFGANQWTEAAVDAIKRQGTSGVNANDTNSLLDFAERYNGLGYRNKGVPSPYVWAGTTNYQCGKYVADGVYDANYVDSQLGVAVMMKAIS